MASISVEPCADNFEDQQQTSIKQFFRSRWTFVGLQLLDLLTTMYAFHVGALEINPLVAHLTMLFGRFRGVLISKLMAVAVAMGVRRLMWVVNVIYLVVVGWNLVTIGSLLLQGK